MRPTIRTLGSAVFAAAAAIACSTGVAGAAPADAGSSSGSAIVSTASDTVGSGPEMSAFLAAFGYGLTNPDAAPAGANDWNCKPSADHPRPVVLVHGTWLNTYDSFSFLSPQLARAGFCVFAYNFGRETLLGGGGIGPILPGRYGVGPLEDSAKQLGAFVDRVLAATGAPAVDVLAHSQGGPVTNQYLKFEGGQGKVRKVVTFGATTHGTSLLGLASLGRFLTNLGLDVLGFYQPLIGQANTEQVVGSPFYAKLNADGDTVPGVDYTAIGTTHDEISNPYEWTFLTPGPGATVENVTLQQDCPEDVSDHLTILYSPRAASIALRALDPVAHPNLVCTFNPWIIGGSGHL
ncbi:alpha/beta fold hydrolase [Nocardia yunnanensis]|uniref:Alpha/beta fold hydrolase n=1 Tax=Nocardia yunnanensis TaxID=2382165 RepID=A0A386ZE56_9NOCA|nr:alpha/beta fold hydrolase [Nocardia yunnanensis]AYF75941.1 alpha/beta fold hydrolase [Nocardia yunnanensis]